MPQISLKTKFCNINFSNPTVLASGILGISAPQLKRVAKGGAAGLTLKSIGPRPRPGHPNPTILVPGDIMINCVGLPTPGYKNMDEKWEELGALKNTNVVIASIYGGTTKEFIQIAKYVASKKPHLIELNLSCPNTDKEGANFASNLDIIKEVVFKTKKAAGSIPIMPKLSPNVPDIAAVAKACEKAGADAISAINTVGPGMIINLETRKPIMSYKKGGISGPAIKPIAIRCVYDIYEATSLPILGIGGITTGEDAIEMMMAGATLIGIGSGVYYRGIDIFDKVNKEIIAWMKKNNVKNLKDIVGSAHKNR